MINASGFVGYSTRSKRSIRVSYSRLVVHLYEYDQTKISSFKEIIARRARLPPADVARRACPMCSPLLAIACESPSLAVHEAQTHQAWTMKIWIEQHRFER